MPSPDTVTLTSAPPVTDATQDLLRLSTDLQSLLIADLAAGAKLDALIARITDKVDGPGAVLQVDACAIYIVDETAGLAGDGTATMRAASGYQKHFINQAICHVLPPDGVPDSPSLKEDRLGLTGWVISTGKAFLAKTPAELKQHPHQRGDYDPVQLPEPGNQVGTFLAVPLRNLRGKIIGAMKAERLEPCEPFSVKDQLVLEALARVAGRCIDYVEERDRSADAAITLWAREVIEEAVATEGELDAFLDIVVRVAASATQADSGAIFLIDESKKTLTQRAGWGSQVLRKVVRSYEVPGPEKVAHCLGTRSCSPADCKRVHLSHDERVGLTAWVAATGRQFRARNMDELKEHCHHKGFYDSSNYEKQQECGAWLGVPLQIGGVITGVLKVENVFVRGTVDDRDFSDVQQRRLDLLAHEIALASERLQTQYAKRYVVIHKAMEPIRDMLSGKLDVQKLVKEVVHDTAKLFHAEACALFLKQGNELVQPHWAAYGWATRGPRVRRYQLVADKDIVDRPVTEDQKVGLTVWIAVKREKFTARSNLDLTLHPHHRGTFDRHNFAKGRKCQSFMGIPLLAGGKGKQKELVGVLKVETKTKGKGADKEFAYFNGQEELAFELIANSAAISIQNARLVESGNLADHVLASPNNDAVVEVVHGFLKDHEEGVNSLDSAAAIVDREDSVKARIVRTYAGLLHPAFQLGVLDQLVSDLHGPSKDLLSALTVALKSSRLGDIQTALQRSGPVISRVTAREFFLRELGERYTTVAQRVSDRLAEYDRDPSRRIELRECLNLLKIPEDQLSDLSLLERTMLTRVFGDWSKLIDEAVRVYLEVDSPYITTKPLPADSPLFYGREEIFEWIEAKLFSKTGRGALVLHGGSHTGKTSVLRQLQSGQLGKRIREGRQFPVYPVFLDLQLLGDSTAALMSRMAEEVDKALGGRGLSCTVPPAEEFTKGPRAAFDRTLESAVHAMGGRGKGLVLIMLDEFECLHERVKNKKYEADIFYYLRALMQEDQGVAFILAGHRELEEMDLKYKVELFNVAHHREVGFLEPKEANDLIRTPVQVLGVTYDDAVVDRILSLTGGHPYLIQQLCDYCVEEMNSQKCGYWIGPEYLEKSVGRS